LIVGKTSRPLTILLTETELLNWPGFQKLASQGHTILTLDELLKDRLMTSPNLVMGAKAHYLAPGMEKLVDIALKGARSLRYPPKTKE
jgi:hypothetical protein